MTSVEIEKAINEAVNFDTLSHLYSAYVDRKIEEMFAEEFRKPDYSKFALCGSLVYNYPLQVQQIRCIIKNIV